MNAVSDGLHSTLISAAFTVFNSHERMITQKRPWQVYLVLIVLMQGPNMIRLVSHGWLLQVLGATLVGTMLGQACRPVIQKQFMLLMPIALAVLLAEFLTDDDVAWRLIHQVLVVFMLVSAWPRDPKQRNRRSTQRVKRIRRWSTGIPRAASLKSFRQMGGQSHRKSRLDGKV